MKKFYCVLGQNASAAYATHAAVAAAQPASYVTAAPRPGTYHVPIHIWCPVFPAYIILGLTVKWNLDTNLVPFYVVFIRFFLDIQLLASPQVRMTPTTWPRVEISTPLRIRPLPPDVNRFCAAFHGLTVLCVLF